MAEKPQARGMQIPPGRTVPDESPGAVLGTESLPVEPEMDDKLPAPSESEEKQLDMLVGALKDFIWDEGYDAIVEKIQAGQDDLAETIGVIAGRMINREVKASDEGGNPFSRDLLYAAGAEIVNELFNLAENAGLYKVASEEQNQQVQGEALIYAAQKYVDEGDDKIDPSGSMKLAAKAVRGGYPQEEMVAKMGVPVEEEVIDVEEV